MDSNEIPLHFKGKEAIEHVIEARIKGKAASAEIHGAELAGHYNAAADAAKETALILLIVWTLFSEFQIPTLYLRAVSLSFIVGWLFWKVGRSAILGYSRLERLHRLMNAVGAGLVVQACQHRPAPCRLDGRDDLRRVGRDQNRPDVRLHGAPPDVDDHRLAVNVRERLVRQPGRGHAGWNENDGIGHASFRQSGATLRPRNSGKKYQSGGAYTCCQAGRKAFINRRRVSLPPGASSREWRSGRTPSASPRSYEISGGAHGTWIPSS